MRVVQRPASLTGSDKIWRYMDYAKLTSLLISRSLWFPALWKLEDPFEGILLVPSIHARMDEAVKSMGLTEVPALEEMKRFGYFTSVQAIRVSTFVNCWNKADEESISLWKIYGHDGLAVQTTVDRLIASLPKNGGHEIEVDLVNYQLDPENNPALSGTWPGAVLTKDLTYSYEQELRLYFTDPGPIGSVFDATLEPVPGQPINVELDTLIERIVVSPYQSEWFEKLLRQLLERLEMNPGLVSSSRFRRQPVYRLGPSGVTRSG